ncbi:MAG: hypothetical protein QXW32_01580 [Nitrososphaerales archaeon]
MASYYLLIVKDHRCDGKLIKAIEIFEDRVKNRFWGLGRRSAHLKRIRCGDKVVFYVGGRYGGLLVGSGTVGSEPHPISEEERKRGLCLHSEVYTHLMTFSEIEVWPKPVLLKDICGQLSFITDKSKPRIYLQGAVKRLGEDDYRTICSAAKYTA